MPGVVDRRDLDQKTSPLCDVVVNGDTGQVLAMVQGRSKAALSRFFVEQGPRWCYGVQTVVTDGSRSYRAAIGRYLPHTRHVLDRFHAVRWFTQGLTLVRRELQRRQPPGVKPAFDPDLFRARFCLLKRHDHLTGAEQKRLDRLFDDHPRLRTPKVRVIPGHDTTADANPGSLYKAPLILTEWSVHRFFGSGRAPKEIVPPHLDIRDIGSIFRDLGFEW